MSPVTYQKFIFSKIFFVQFDHDFKGFTSAWTVDDFVQKWLKVEEKILTEIIKLGVPLLQSCEMSVEELQASFQNPSIDIGTQNLASN